VEDDDGMGEREERGKAERHRSGEGARCIIKEVTKRERK